MNLKSRMVDAISLRCNNEFGCKIVASLYSTRRIFLRSHAGETVAINIAGEIVSPELVEDLVEEREL